MYEWQKQIQVIVDEIDNCIKHYNNEALTLRFLSQRLGYSEYYTTRKFKEISGMQFRDYLRHRKLAFALKEVRDSRKSLLDIAFDYGKSRVSFRGRTVKPFAAYSTVLKASWTTTAEVNPTAAAASLWPISTIRKAGSAIGAFLAPSVMAYAFPWIIKVKFRLKCSWPISRKLSIWFLNTGPLIMSRKTAA